MKFKFLILFVMFAGCVSAPTNIARRPAYYGTEKVQFKHEKLNFAKFLNSVKTNRATTVADALAALKKSYAPYMTVHTLVYESLSLQEASFLEPRALVFGPEANFVFSFNGGTHQRGGYAIETMEFNSVAAQFQFREVAFKKEMKPEEADDLPADDVEYQDERIKVSKANPSRCTQCHGANPQPIWETYYFWPGVYGSNDDILTSIFHRNEVERNPNYKGFGVDKSFGASQGRTLGLQPGAVDKESEGFRKHIAARPTHPRYRYLPLRAIDQAYVRWNAGEVKEDIDTSKAVETEKESLGLNYDSDRPNLNLTMRLYEQTSPKFARDAKKISRRLPLQLAYMEFCGSEEIRNWTPDDYLKEEDILSKWPGVFTAAEIAQIKRVSGPWLKFMKKDLTQEMTTEAEKIYRFSKVFGPEALLSINHQGNRPPYSFYKNFVPQMPQYAEFITERESEDPFGEAMHDYVANGMGLKFENYVTNMRRAPTFREGGFRFMADPKLYPEIFPVQKSIPQTQTDCAELKKRLTQP